LIHWPGAQGLKVDSLENKEKRKEAWLDLERIIKEGNSLVRNIGVSNYTMYHLEDLLSYASVKPVLNQVSSKVVVF
jgi:diketogulonate reductase-like aldo/keto reductase